MNQIKYSTIGLMAGSLLFGALAGCGGSVEAPPPAQVVVAPTAPAPAAAPAPAEAALVVQNDYVYYPAYEVYYSGSRHHYFYRDGNAWVSRPAPPHVSVNVLLASPSVRVDFHDSPANHHAIIVNQYPKHWTPSGPGRASKDDHDGRRDDDDRKGKPGRE